MSSKYFKIISESLKKFCNREPVLSNVIEFIMFMAEQLV